MGMTKMRETVRARALAGRLRARARELALVGFHRERRPGAMRGERGQMTIELVVAIPVLIAVAVIAVNALTFFAECAVFDRAACEAVRTYGTSPAYGQDIDSTLSLVKQTIEAQCDEPNVEVEVEHGVTSADFDEYRAKLSFHPTLFGAGLRSEVFGVSLPSLTHEVRYVIDSYKPGVLI